MNASKETVEEAGGGRMPSDPGLPSLARGLWAFARHAGWGKLFRSLPVVGAIVRGRIKGIGHDSPYVVIARNVDLFIPETAPKAPDGVGFHDAFVRYLELVYSPDEAELVQHLRGVPRLTPASEVAEASGRSVEYVEKLLAEAHSRNGLVKMGDLYGLPPMPNLVNIHQFYPEVKPDDLEAARLYREYFIEGGYSKYYQSSKRGTSLARTIPVNRSIEPGQKILSAEEAHDFILNHAPEGMALVPCPCRTRTEKLGIRECQGEKPIGACIMLGPAAAHFEGLGLGKRVTREQAIDYFDEMQDLGLVGQTANAVSNGIVICLCCKCCCSQVRGRTLWGNPHALAPSNFVPHTTEDCTGCAACVERCFFGAIEIDADTDRSTVDPGKCIGCGLCTMACPQEILKLHRHERSTPFQTFEELAMTVAIENRTE
jgi:ferredoxin